MISSYCGKGLVLTYAAAMFRTQELACNGQMQISAAWLVQVRLWVHLWVEDIHGSALAHLGL